jgi:hypothetical protein
METEAVHTKSIVSNLKYCIFQQMTSGSCWHYCATICHQIWERYVMLFPVSSQHSSYFGFQRNTETLSNQTVGIVTTVTTTWLALASDRNSSIYCTSQTRRYERNACAKFLATAC